MFIELHEVYSPIKVLVNINSIKMIYWNNDECNTLIEFVDGDHVYFYESFSEIKSLVEHEVAAERGY